jgi:hypothetical protein
VTGHNSHRESRSWRDTLFTGLCWFQGLYFFTTGIWPVLHVRSFKWVTGEKTDNLPSGLDADHWLLMTVSSLILAVAITLLVAAWRKTRELEIAILAMAAAAGLTTIDIVYVTRGVILPIYLLDAAIEIPLILLWLGCLALTPRAAAGAD